MKYSDFQAVPQFPQANYRIDVDLGYLKQALNHWDERASGSPLILNPEWQRGHVWTKKQQISYVEFMLRGGTTGREIYFNCSSWDGGYNTPVYCVDGLQRLTACLNFVDNKFPAFETLYKDFTGRLRMGNARLHFNMLKLKSKRELLNLYIMFNSGGSVHKPKEIERIKIMLDNTPESETL